MQYKNTEGHSLTKTQSEEYKPI